MRRVAELACAGQSSDGSQSDRPKQGGRSSLAAPMRTTGRARVSSARSPASTASKNDNGPADERTSSDSTASIITNTIRTGSSPRFAQAWFVPRCTTASPTPTRVSDPSSSSNHVSPAEHDADVQRLGPVHRGLRPGRHLGEAHGHATRGRRRADGAIDRLGGLGRVEQDGRLVGDPELVERGGSDVERLGRRGVGEDDGLPGCVVAGDDPARGGTHGRSVRQCLPAPPHRGMRRRAQGCGRLPDGSV